MGCVALKTLLGKKQRFQGRFRWLAVKTRRAGTSSGTRNRRNDGRGEWGQEGMEDGGEQGKRKGKKRRKRCIRPWVPSPLLFMLVLESRHSRWFRGYLKAACSCNRV